MNNVGMVQFCVGTTASLNIQFWFNGRTGRTRVVLQPVGAFEVTVFDSQSGLKGSGVSPKKPRLLNAFLPLVLWHCFSYQQR